MLPRIFELNEENICVSNILSDLGIEQIFSSNAKSFLLKSYSRDEISSRQELFSLLLNNGKISKVKKCLSSLKFLERTAELLKLAETEIEKIYYQIELVCAYKDVVESFIDANDCGVLFSRVSEYFLAQIENVSLMSNTVISCREHMSAFTSGIISFSEKIWITPEESVSDDFDEIVSLAKQIGLVTNEKKKFGLKIDKSLSDALCEMNSDKISKIKSLISVFDNVNYKKVLSYINELEFICEIYELFRGIREKGIKTCFAKIADKPRYIAKDIIDLKLLFSSDLSVVPNDAEFTEENEFGFLIGANSGGKTTYLRALAVNLILFLVGCPVLATQAEIFPFEFVMTHFTAEERFVDVGRLDDELNRVNEILKYIKGRRVFLFFNETFSGTDDKRGFELLRETVDTISNNNCFGLWVTHFHEVLTLNYPVLSVQVSEDNERTYRIEKSKCGMSSYALDILKKYRIDKESLKERIRRNES